MELREGGVMEVEVMEEDVGGGGDGGKGGCWRCRRWRWRWCQSSSRAVIVSVRLGPSAREAGGRPGVSEAGTAGRNKLFSGNFVKSVELPVRSRFVSEIFKEKKSSFNILIFTLHLNI